VTPTRTIFSRNDRSISDMTMILPVQPAARPRLYPPMG
jgi:hypothetical protein